MKYSSSSAMRSHSRAISSSGFLPIKSKTSLATFLMARARVVILVYAMAEAHQFGIARLHALDEFRHFLHRADFHQHAQHFFVRTAMQRSVQRGDGRRGCRVRIHMGTAYVAYRAGRTVLLVIGMQDK